MDALSEDHLPEYTDHYRDALDEVITAQAEGRKVEPAGEAPQPAGQVVGLMAALSASAKAPRRPAARSAPPFTTGCAWWSHRCLALFDCGSRTRASTSAGAAPAIAPFRAVEHGLAGAGCDPACMNHLGDAHLRTWTLRFMALLAAEAQDQVAWLGERELETESVVEEVELLCRISEGLAGRGAFASKDLSGLQAIRRRLGEIDAACRAGLWGNALATDPAWDEIRPLARQFLLTTLGDWRQPLPRPVPDPRDGQRLAQRRRGPSAPGTLG
ncbi:hypothetical protein HW130_25290 [Streptomyces sp. PKU-EA00015]|nr:hypothetical protein [Streptomyces sp. PKU-EA00015]NWF29528.1 hypothetical protein [Streptomyces sp. PKU-EA00015]